MDLVTSSIDAVNANIELMEKHLEILDEQRSVTSDAVDKTLCEGEALLVHLKETSAKNNAAAAEHANGPEKQHSNSYVHMDGKQSDR